MKKDIKIALLDFDGTLVSKDILDLLCQSVGKEKESRELNEAFHRGEVEGLSALITRINFLKGMTKDQINLALAPNNYLLPGAKELMQFFKQHGIVTILASGNILPVLEYYQRILGITHIVGSQPKMEDGAVLGIDESAFSSKTFKIDNIQKILEKYPSVTKENIIALGDSPSDKGMFEMSSFSIAVNPKGNIAEFANRSIDEDLNDAVTILQEILIK